MNGDRRSTGRRIQPAGLDDVVVSAGVEGGVVVGVGECCVGVEEAGVGVRGTVCVGVGAGPVPAADLARSRSPVVPAGRTNQVRVCGS
jgi:hypothetical protein